MPACSRSDSYVTDANQVLFFNAHQPYRVSHPVPGGDACLSVAVLPAALDELAPCEWPRHSGRVWFPEPARTMSPQTQRAAAVFRHRIGLPHTEAIEAESRALEVTQRVFQDVVTPRRQHSRRRRAFERLAHLLGPCAARPGVRLFQPQSSHGSFPASLRRAALGAAQASLRAALALPACDLSGFSPSGGLEATFRPEPEQKRTPASRQADGRGGRRGPCQDRRSSAPCPRRAVTAPRRAR